MKKEFFHTGELLLLFKTMLMFTGIESNSNTYRITFKEYFVRKLILALILITLSSTSYSQIYYNWNPVASPSTANFNSIGKIGNDMLIAGNNGTCFLLNGAATSWTVYNTGTTADLNSVNTYNTIFIGGNNGLILKASAPGNNWTNVNLPVSQNVNCVSTSLGAAYKMVCGDNGILYITTNSGTNWTSLNSNTTNNLRNIFYDVVYSSSRAYVCGDNGTFRKVILTFPPVPPAISVFTYSTGFNNNFYCATGLGTDSNKILMVGSSGMILKSTNGGTSWTQQVSNTTKNLRYIYANSENDIYVCGDQGAMLRTTNGGASWNAQVVNSGADLKGMTIVNNVNGYNIGYAIGSSGTILSSYFPPPLSDTSIKRIKLDGGSISTYFQTTGVFNQNTTIGNSPGFEWPKGSGRYAIFTSGLSIAAMVNGQLREAICSYKGELWPGQIIGGIPQLPIELNKIWKVKEGDNCTNSVDWANWGLIVPYGAPYRDMNNNGVYDPCVDIPGMRNANQTIFMALTDGYAYKHTPGEGFGGGTPPLNADIKITAWTYNDPIITDVQFIKFDVINRGSSAWSNLYFSLTGDYDLGDANDDYFASDSTRNMWIGYNADNNDGTGGPPTYGINPPAVGMRVLKFPVNKSVTPYDTIKTTSGITVSCNGCGTPSCENLPDGFGIYNFMKGFKSDGSHWMNPTFTPPRPVKFVYGGNPPGSSSDWTEYQGSIRNCGGDTGAYIPVNPSGDRRHMLSMGKENFTMAPGDSQSIVVAQLIARGTNNWNSVTRLKALADIVAGYTVGINQISSIIPSNFTLSQNYPNPFNPTTTIKFAIPSSSTIKIAVYDITGKEVEVLVNERLQAGTFEANWNGERYSSGVYFYRLETEGYSESKRMLLIK